MTDPRRLIPSVEQILESPKFREILDDHPRGLVVSRLREEVEEVRRTVGPDTEPAEVTDLSRYAERVSQRLARAGVASLRPVINGTGVVLHTNLGRAALARSALEAIEGAKAYSNLEYDLAAGQRGSRYHHCTELLRELTGAEGALVVNNGAAALLLALSTMAAGRHVLVSRGELVEIGGGFRIPEIMESSGARLWEVGSTNRTRLEDYRQALSEADAALILKVHRSNFRITGFTEEAALPDLAELGREAGIGVLHDLGSGLLVDAELLGLPPEPRPAESLAAGVDAVAFSGDKLLGGPQAGVLLGRGEWIDRMRKNPLCRALRVDKTTLMALEATLRLYRDPDRAIREIPALAMLRAAPQTLEKRSRALVAGLCAEGVEAEGVEVSSVVGGGTYPGVELPSRGIRVDPGPLGAEGLAALLRSADPPLVGRVEDGSLWIDLRTVLDWQDSEVLRLLVAHAGR